MAVAAMAAGQFDPIRDRTVLVILATGDTVPGRAVPPRKPAGAAFRNLKPVKIMVDAPAAAGGAQQGYSGLRGQTRQAACCLH